MTLRELLIGASIALALTACQRRDDGASAGTDREPGASQEGEEGEAESRPGRGQRAQASRRIAAGSTCSGRDDCTSDQVCVEARCAYRATSVAGEVLASAAAAQMDAGDWEGAIETYDQAFTAFRAKGAPVPPEIACGAAELILRTAVTAEARERGARAADHCFRVTVPGHESRVSVRRAIARLRYEGLEISLFDADAPAERFFTREASRPTVDAVRVEVQMPDLEPREPPSHTAVRARFATEEGHRAIAECFIQDWEISHNRDATAQVGMRFSTRLRDMGSYDVYEPSLEIEQTTPGEDGFEPCLAASLPNLFDPENRSLRGEGWEQVVRFTARLQ